MTRACVTPAGRIAEHTDCDDDDFWVNPNEPEVCFDSTDNDCSEETSDQDCDGDGYDSNRVGGPDCDDDLAWINPGAPEDCDDGYDNDCDEAADSADSDCD